MTLITFNKIRPVIIYPVLAMITHLTNIAFVAMSGYSFTDQDQDQDKDQIKQIKNNNYLILLSIIMFSEVITFIFYFIQKRNTEQKMKRKLKILPKTLKNKIKSILIIILIVCINFPSTVIQLYIFQNNFLEFLEKIVNGLSLVFATILCALILNYRYYKHHVVGLCILLTGHTLFSVYDLYVTGENAESPDDGESIPSSCVISVCASAACASSFCWATSVWVCCKVCTCCFKSSTSCSS